MKATRKNNLVEIVKLIAHGVDINKKSSKSNSCASLHIAVKNGFTVLCDLLLQNGADCNIIDANGWTPLHHAACTNKVDCLILLIRRGAKLNITSKDNQVSPVNNY